VKEFSDYQNLWNYGFLASGLLLMAVGFTIMYQRSFYRPRLDKEMDMEN